MPTPFFTVAASTPRSLTVHLSGQFAYLRYAHVSEILMLARDNVTKNFSFLNPSSFATDTSSDLERKNLAMSSDGLFLYSVNGGAGTISQMSIHQSTGQLSALSPPTIATGNTPISMAISPDGKSIYVGNRNDGTISQYSRDESTGLLTSLGTIASDYYTEYIAVSADGLSVYVSSSFGKSIYEYSRNPTSGLLTSIGVIDAGSTRNMAITPDGKFLYSDDYNAPHGFIRVYSRNTTTGLLSEIGRYDIGSNIDALKISPDGWYLYVADVKTEVYQINPITGLLSLIQQSPNVGCWEGMTFVP